MESYAGFKVQEGKKKEKQNEPMKRKLSSVTPRDESPGFPPGDQVPNGRDVYYVHLLSREGVLRDCGELYT